MASATIEAIALTENDSVNWFEHAGYSPICAGLSNARLDARERVSDIQRAARLQTLAVGRERSADHGLHDEPIQYGTEIRPS